MAVVIARVYLESQRALDGSPDKCAKMLILIACSWEFIFDSYTHIAPIYVGVSEKVFSGWAVTAPLLHVRIYILLLIVELQRSQSMGITDRSPLSTCALYTYIVIMEDIYIIRRLLIRRRDAD